jgi:hypothetical protein
MLVKLVVWLQISLLVLALAEEDMLMILYLNREKMALL